MLIKLSNVYLLLNIKTLYFMLILFVSMMKTDYVPNYKEGDMLILGVDFGIGVGVSCLHNIL